MKAKRPEESSGWGFSPEMQKALRERGMDPDEVLRATFAPPAAPEAGCYACGGMGLTPGEDVPCEKCCVPEAEPPCWHDWVERPGAAARTYHCSKCGVLWDEGRVPLSKEPEAGEAEEAEEAETCTCGRWHKEKDEWCREDHVRWPVASDAEMICKHCRFNMTDPARNAQQEPVLYLKAPSCGQGYIGLHEGTNQWGEYVTVRNDQRAIFALLPRTGVIPLYRHPSPTGAGMEAGMQLADSCLLWFGDSMNDDQHPTEQKIISLAREIKRGSAGSPTAPERSSAAYAPTDFCRCRACARFLGFDANGMANGEDHWRVVAEGRAGAAWLFCPWCGEGVRPAPADRHYTDEQVHLLRLKLESACSEVRQLKESAPSPERVAALEEYARWAQAQLDWQGGERIESFSSSAPAERMYTEAEVDDLLTSRTQGCMAGCERQQAQAVAAAREEERASRVEVNAILIEKVRSLQAELAALRQAGPGSAEVRELVDFLEQTTPEARSEEGVKARIALVKSAPSPRPALSAEAVAVVEAAIEWYRNSWTVTNGHFRKLVGALLAADPEGKWREGLLGAEPVVVRVEGLVVMATANHQRVVLPCFPDFKAEANAADWVERFKYLGIPAVLADAGAAEGHGE